MTKDNVNRPQHYTSHPSGVECIQVTEHMGFNLGNVIKYVWRADLKGASIEDLEKALWYLKREIQKRKEAEPIVMRSGLTTEQKAELFDWICLRFEHEPFQISPIGDDYGDFTGMVMWDPFTKKPIAQGATAQEALHKAFLADQEKQNNEGEK